MDWERKFIVVLIWVCTPMCLCFITLIYYDYLIVIGKLHILIGMWIGLLPGLAVSHLIYVIGIHDGKLFEDYKEVLK